MTVSANQRALDQCTDEQLVELYRQGQQPAFVTLLERYRQELFHFLIRFVGDASTAEDLFQETFLQVHLSADSFDISRAFRPWLFTIGANKARDYLRRNNQRTAMPLSVLVGRDQDQARPLVDLLQDDLPLPSQNVVAQEVEESVRQVVHSMPEHLREILLLAYFHQFPYKRIAQMLGIPLGTVKSRLHAAVGTFAELWKHRHSSEEK